MIYLWYNEGGIIMITFLILLALILGVIIISFLLGGTAITVIADVIVGFILLMWCIIGIFKLCTGL